MELTWCNDMVEEREGSGTSGDVGSGGGICDSGLVGTRLDRSAEAAVTR